MLRTRHFSYCAVRQVFEQKPKFILCVCSQQTQLCMTLFTSEGRVVIYGGPAQGVTGVFRCSMHICQDPPSSCNASSSSSAKDGPSGAKSKATSKDFSLFGNRFLFLGLGTRKITNSNLTSWPCHMSQVIPLSNFKLCKSRKGRNIIELSIIFA